MHGEAAPGRQPVIDTAQQIDRHGLGPALQLQRSARLELELALRELKGGATHQRLPRLRRGLQARRRVHGVAGDRIGGARRCAEIAGNDSTGIDADVERQRLAETAVPTLAEHRHPFMHLDRGVQGPLRVVLVRHRRAEHRHHRVADEFLEEGIEPLDHRAQGGEQVGLQGTHILGIQLLRDRREAAQVGEQHGCRSTVGIGRRDGNCRRRGGQLVAATRAEREVDRHVELAALALHQRMVCGDGR